MLKLLEQHHPQVLFGKLGIHQRQRGALEGQVPGGEPRILPVIGHRQDAHRVQVPPVLIANGFPRWGRWAVAVIALKPETDVKEINLLAPQHAGKSLPLDQPFIIIGTLRMDRGVELVGFAAPHLKDFFDVFERRFAMVSSKAKISNVRVSRRHHHPIDHAGLGT